MLDSRIILNLWYGLKGLGSREEVITFPLKVHRVYFVFSTRHFNRDVIQFNPTKLQKLYVVLGETEEFVVQVVSGLLNLSVERHKQV